ncbi:MAG: hypothetical protein WCL32_07580 [Planctomycetota bacterium]|jgi:hypothetical protein
MPLKTLLQPVLDDDLLTRGLGDEEARLLIDWLVDQAELIVDRIPSLDRCRDEIARLCRRARALSRFVSLWCHHGSHGAACQLAASERFTFPLPLPEIDAYDLMNEILNFEEGECLQRVELLAG